MDDNGTMDIDTSLRRIVITEDEDLNLDKLLTGDNSGAAAAAQSPSQPPPRAEPRSSALAAAPGPARPILALEEDGDEGEDGHWVLPAPARPGDYLAGSLHRVPSKSILKKTSSYSTFSTFDVSERSSKTGGSAGAKKASFLSFRNLDMSSSSQGSVGGAGRRDRVASSGDPLDSSIAGGMSKMAKKTSFLSMGYPSQGSLNSGGNGEQQVAIGWDLEDSPSLSPGGNGKFLVGAPPPSLPCLPIDLSADEVADETSDADRAAGMDASGSRHSAASSAKMKRNVSFHSVDVREYDRTVGDNPSCRSGPPISLDWSYSKKYSRDVNEYEVERSSERVSDLRKLHVNKWKRRNMLSHNWGHTEDELKEARRGTRRMQRQRSMTQAMLPVHVVEEAVISFRNFLKKKKKKGGERDDGCLSDMSDSGSTKDSSFRDSHQYGYDGLYGQTPPGGLSFRSTRGLSFSTHSAQTA